MIEINGLYKIYDENKENEFIALNNVSFTIGDGELLAIIGKSGAGKSTLLHVLAGIENATKGTILLDNANISDLNGVKKSSYRNKTIGLILQDFYLLNDASVLENVLLPLQFVKMKGKRKIEKATELIYGVCLETHTHQKVYKLSGGEKQRVAIARALVNDAKYILADEPTGSLDSANSTEIMDLLSRINKGGKTVIIITHDMEIANRCGRIIELCDGKIVNDTILCKTIENGEQPIKNIMVETDVCKNEKTACTPLE